MATRLLLGVLVGTLLAACTTTDSTPATTPTTTAPTTTTSTTATAPPSTTSAPDRLAEIQAIFQDLEERRLDALYRGDVEAFSALFANEAYLERSLGAFEVIEFSAQPAEAGVRVEQVLVDTPGCIAADLTYEPVDAIVGSSKTSNRTVVEYVSGEWGLSYAGEGWACDGSHPLE